MADPENGGGSDGPRRSTRGVPIYAVESLVVSVIEFGWLAIPPVAGGWATADRLLLLPLAIAGVLNVLMCSLTEDNRTSLGAFASLALTCTSGYLLVLLESFSVQPYAHVYFGNSPLLQFFGAGILAVMALHSLLALAAVHDRLWAQTAWIEGTLFLMPFLLAAACVQSGRRTHGLAALGPALLFWVLTAILALFDARARFLFVLTRLAALATALTGSIVAATTGLTRWAYLVMAATLLFLYACRSFSDWRQIVEANASDAQLQQVVHSAPPQPQEAAPPPMPAGATHAMVFRANHSAIPYTALRATGQNAEAVLFGGHGRYLKQQSKKCI